MKHGDRREAHRSTPRGFRRLAGTVRLLALSAAAWMSAYPARANAEERIYHDDFSGDLRQWVVEQQPGGRVFLDSGRLVIADVAGCTVWLRHTLEVPVIIRYEVTAVSSARVSDLNCFWMATHPTNPLDLFAANRPRSGRFPDYDGLRAYYVGYGGNDNSTTRFRRYDGTGARPLMPEHDRRNAEVLLRPDHRYRIELRALSGGRVQFVRDGEIVFDVLDPQPLTRGWFGFRTVNSRLEISHFEVLTPTAGPTSH